MSKFDDWSRDEPTEPGWYATLTCWDPQEGYFPGSHYWDGSAWSEQRPIVGRSSKSFATEAEADAWAEAHDPEM